MKLVSAEEMRQIDKDAASYGLTTEILMERAGLEVAKEIKRFLGSVLGKRLLFLIGPGNNGGDGLVAARYLNNWGAHTHLYLPQPRKDRNFILCQENRMPFTLASEDEGFTILRSLISRADGVVDALFGTGKRRPLEGVYKEITSRVKEAKRERPLIFALDLPSGLDADTGEIDPFAIPADITITLGYPKRGLFSFPGREIAGKIKVADIGYPLSLAQGVNTELITSSSVKSLLPPRPKGAHKGSFGRVLVIAGSLNYIGAAFLACEGTARVGAGLVSLATPKSIHPILASKLTEITHIPLPDEEGGFISKQSLFVLKEWLPRYDVLLIGCGLGQKEGTAEFLYSLLPDLKEKPLVLDADALNILAKREFWWHIVPDNAIITPHPAEMGRLSRLSTEEIQKDRIEVTRKHAEEWGKVIVLKGAHTVIASPQGKVFVSPFANPGLASAGTGDVVAGAIAGFLTQGLSPIDAAITGVYIHGLAGEIVKSEIGDAGMLAGDLLLALPKAIKRLKEGFEEEYF